MAKSYVDKKELGKLIDHVSTFGRRTVAAVKSEIYEDAVKVFKESQEQVPVLSGDLRASGMLEVDEESMSARIIISYNEEHAMDVHENVKQYTFNHDKSSHYLSRPFSSIFHASGYDKKLVDRALKRAESGAGWTTFKGIRGSPGPLADRTQSRYSE